MNVWRRAGFVIAVMALAAGVRSGAQAPAPLGDAPAASGRATAAAPSQAALDRAAAILAQTRQALGGDARAAVKTVLVTGRTRRLRGDNLVPIEFEIAIELPDRYVRRDESPAEDTAPTSVGFNGDDLIQIPPPPPVRPPASGSGAVTAAEQAAAQRTARLAAAVTAAKQDFARLAVGLFANTFSYPMTFAFAAEAEAPQGRADVLDGRAPDGFALRLFIDEATHLPIMVSWQAPPTAVVVLAPGQPQPATIAPGAVVVAGPAPPAATASQADKDQYAKDVAALRAKTMVTRLENRLYFADYREDGGVTFPSRLRRAIGTETTEETVFDRFKLNPKIDPKKFQAAK